MICAMLPMRSVIVPQLWSRRFYKLAFASVLASVLAANARPQTVGQLTPAVVRTNIVHAPPPDNLPRMLRERQRQEIEAAKTLKAFHDFQFTDRMAESKITFKQSSVEDALKWWKGVHYDHGTGIAVADVDGDGRLDIYFVNQLGANQLWRNLGNGQFEDITARAGVGLEGRIHVAASFA